MSQDGPDFRTMNVWGMDSRSTERLLTAWIDRDFWTANGFENAAGVGGGILQRCIAMDGCNAQKVQIRVMSSNQDCKCVL